LHNDVLIEQEKQMIDQWRQEMCISSLSASEEKPSRSRSPSLHSGHNRNLLDKLKEERTGLLSGEVHLDKYPEDKNAIEQTLAEMGVKRDLGHSKLT
jgi:hypothetical protein